jgi:flagellar hook-associated protein 3 FlgL
MRITNKMMSGNSLANINTNKEYLDKLNNQMATQKKITRPSDDPIIAIRALRLRSNLSELTQYYGANVPDAQAWVDVTQSAINSTKEMLSSLKAYADQGANGTNTASDRQKIYETVQALQKQIYSNGNATNAGRSVFTGYRTGESLTFKSDTSADYRGIADSFNASDVTRNTYVDSPFSMDSINAVEVEEVTGKLDKDGKITIAGTEYTPTKDASGHYSDITVSYTEGGETKTRTYKVSDDGVVTTARTGETDVKEDTVNRIRLSYDNINTKVKASGLPGKYSGDEAATLTGWEEGTVKWEDYVQDGRLINPGSAFATGVSMGGWSGDLKLDPKCDQTLNCVPENPNFCEVVGRFKDEDQYVGDVNRAGRIYATSFMDTTTLTYRTALEEEASIPPSSVVTDPVEGLKSFEIDYNGETYMIKKLDGANNDGGWWAVNSSGACIMKIEVTRNTDQSFNIKVPTNPANPSTKNETVPNSPGSETGYNVFNVSANGRAITSYYHETNLYVQITTSEAAVKTKEGSDLTAYQYLALGADNKNADPAAAKAIYLLADTGELVFGSDVASTLSSLKDIPGVDTISVKYDKSSFEEGELRPEHYFDAVLVDDNHNVLDPVVYDSHNQDITYTVGTNQSIKINTNAEDVFDTQIRRQIDDILTAITDYNAVEEKVNKLKAMQEDPSSYSTDQQEKITKLLNAANKELDIAKNKLQRTYEESITNFGKYFEQANLAETACGTVDSRLTLVSNRLSEEKTTVTTLASDNENVDITNIAVEVSEANLVYNAALMATGRISQQTLVDYI